MEFLQSKFFDKSNILESFLDSGNCLKSLEKNDQISESVKRQFTETFIENIVNQNIISWETIDSINDHNAWSIDFPSWHGPFDITNGKKIFIIGSEPHIHNKYLQTVYGLNNETSVNKLIENGHPIFRYLSTLLSERFGVSNEEVINECYLTDLFPLSPFRGNGLRVGSTDKIQKAIGNSDKWTCIRFKYAKFNLASELEFVKPQIILTQGKDVFYEVVEILGISDQRTKIPIIPETGKKQYVRTAKWKGIPVVSVPHIGSKRMRTFWDQNINNVKDVLTEL